MIKELNSKQIIKFTSLKIREHNPNAKLFLLLHDYAKYFPMAKISLNQIRSPQAIHAYMFSHDADLSVPKPAKQPKRTLE